MRWRSENSSTERSMKIVAGTSCLLVVALFSFLVLRTEKWKPEPPIEGIVTGKQWVPAHDDMSTMLIPDSNGGLMQIPQWTHYNDEWRIFVGSRYVRVSQADFKRIEVEQYFRESIDR